MKESRSSSKTTPFDRLLARRISNKFSQLGASFLLWDSDRPQGAPPTLTAIAQNRRALWKIVRHGVSGAAESYVDGDLDLIGDLSGALRAANRAAAPGGKLTGAGGPRRHRRIDPLAARENAMAHYDLGNDFFALWLDPTLTYTCAYYERPGLSLAEAQEAKLNLICSKLAIGADDRVVDAGCGWGGLAMHIAEHRGAKVRAFNVSPSQIAYAREEAARRGLGHRVEFIEEDYRGIDASFDVFVSVGMLEAVGKAEYATLGAVIKKGLAPGGRGLLHSIGRSEPVPTDAWVERYIFPGSYKPSLAEMLGVFEPNALAVLDVENLRPHYVTTLEQWLARFEGESDRVRDMFDERFVRMWSLYLHAAAAAFATGWLHLYQVMFAHNGETPSSIGPRRLHG